MTISAALPAKPIVFHGRDEFVDEAVSLLTAPGTARLAILGPGGMGKTTLALALLHNASVVSRFSQQHQRLFLSCEAFVDANAVVVALAKLLGLPASGDLLNSVVTHLTNAPPTLLVLDNLETVWLVPDNAAVTAIENLLGKLAQVSSLSLIVTCRGSILPQSVEWSNANGAALNPISLEAALQTFQDKAGHRLSATEAETAKRLLEAVDRMPLAVSLLGQLARRGNTVYELLMRWNREHGAFLRTHGSHRVNNLDVSLELSMTMLRSTDESQEALQLLALCSMLPDGLQPAVFEKLRRYFKQIDQARDALTASALASLGTDRVLRALSPVRHIVLERHPAELKYRHALHSIYLDIARQLPIDMNQPFKQLNEDITPEMDNLSTLLLGLVDEPSQEVVDAVIRFTAFHRHQQPTMTLVSALLPHLEQHPRWKADCLKTMGYTQYALGDLRPTIATLSNALRLYNELGDRCSAAWCQCWMAEVHRFLREYDSAQVLLNEAQAVYTELNDDQGLALSGRGLGGLALMKGDHSHAVKHLSAALQTFSSLSQTFEAARCSQMLGNAYSGQGNLTSAADNLEAARAAFNALGNRHEMAHCTHNLSAVRRRQGNFEAAEQLINEAEAYFRVSGIQRGLAGCAYQFGYLRSAQGRLEEAIEHFQVAIQLFETVEMVREAGIARKEIEKLESSRRRSSV